MTSTADDYPAVLASLLPPSCPHHVLSLPVSPRKPHIASHKISSLSVHPVVEAILHLLNMDLPSAHFLLRHMQAKPAEEAMYIHGILHRIEGDLDNTRAWYGDVKDSEAFQWVWGGMSCEDPGRPSSAKGIASGAQPEASKDRSNGGLGVGSDTSSRTTASAEPVAHAMSFLDRVEAYKVSCLSSGFQPKQSALGNEVPSEASLADVSLGEIRRILSFCERKHGTSTLTDASGVWVPMNEKHADKAADMITGGEGWREF